ncbi:DNA primase, partial [Mesotoga sp. TolDC]|uniref:DNA primase n=1 Tax=Mesotoga sp. TolDC TaxID=1389250 RepID=UPI0021AC7FD7
MFTKEELDEIKKSINIVEFIGRYVNLQKAGSSYRGLCPFHSDNDPSFYVHPQRGFFHCFGCGEKGDIITFYQKIENLSFSEAVKRLADYAGIPIEVDTAESEYDRYTAILSRLAGIYNRELRENNDEILKYLEEKRKISPNTISEFQLGYSPDERTFSQSLPSKLRADEKSLLQFGVLLRRGTSFKDRFAGRLMIPIDNESGRVVGFGGRIMIAEQGPKYINSSESKYFQKNRLLFNLSRAKAAIKQLNYAVIAEGYFDVISLFEAGISNAVGLLGTALTEKHLRILGNYTRNLLFFLDSDAAGQAATLRSVDIAEKMDF